MMRKLLQTILIITGFIFPLIVSAATAVPTEEKILLFDSNIVIGNDALANITEIISVYADKKIITHGIQRRLPSEWIDSSGEHHALTYKVQQTLLNGAKTPNTIKQDGKYISILVGDQTKVLEPGIYSFTIHYTATNAVSNNQFSWDVTGDQWNMLIASAQATVQVPETAKPRHPNSYMCNSPKNVKSTAMRTVKTNQVSFTILHPLMPRECFVVNLGWQN